MFSVLIAEDFCGAHQVWHDHVVVQRDGAVGVQSSPELLAHRQYLRMEKGAVNLFALLDARVVGCLRGREEVTEFIVVGAALKRFDIEDCDLS